MGVLKANSAWLSGWPVFVALLILLIVDRTITLIYFGFSVTDIDQTVLWNGALDYSNGVFHEPCFYGQPYNYMLESLVASPLLWLNIPVYMAMPIATSLIAVLPFVVLGLVFRKMNFHLWAYICLAFPILLPLDYGFLTTISRGFVQGFLFTPLLFIPLAKPRNRNNVTLLFLAFGACFIANYSSLLISLPILIYVFSYHYRSIAFYAKSLLLLPFLALDYFAKQFYVLHPERVLHQLNGLSLSAETFISSFQDERLFDALFPFFPDLGIVYLPIFGLLLILAWVNSEKRSALFIFSILTLLLATFSVPKVQEAFGNSGIFFMSSRLYLSLPLLLIVSLYLVFRKKKQPTLVMYAVFVACLVSLVVKNIGIEEKAEKVFSKTDFPVIKTADLVSRTNLLKARVNEYNIDLIVHSTFAGWDYVFDSYAYHPLAQSSSTNQEQVVSVNIDGDRRTWLFAQAENRKQILLNGVKIDSTLLSKVEHVVVGDDCIIIPNNNLAVSELLNNLGYKFGNE